MLADISNLAENERAMLANIAPIVPEATLTAIERALSGAPDTALNKSTYVVRLLRSLAYEPALFERAISLLIKFARVTTREDVHESEATDIVASLFQIVLSGTHAPLSMRLNVVQELLGSDHADLRAVGIKALNAMLKTTHFSSSYGFEFGASSRNYGYYPSTGQDVHYWYDAVLKMASEFALSDSPVNSQVRKSVAAEFHGLWMNAGQAEVLESLSREIGKKGFWREGWIAVRRMWILVGKAMPTAIAARVTALEKLLRPKHLVDQVRGIVLETSGGSIDFDELEDVENGQIGHAVARMNATIKNLGRDVARDRDAFKTLLPSLACGGSRVRLFGEGLACTDEPYTLWRALIPEFGAAERADVSVIGGFISGLFKRSPAEPEVLLDEALEHPVLGAHFPAIQSSVPIDGRGIGRLHRSLELGKVPITGFYCLAYGRACDDIAGPAFRDLLLAIHRQPGGVPVALEILSMRLFTEKAENREPAPELAEIGRALLSAYEFHRRDGRVDRENRELGRIVQLSLVGDEGIAIVRQLCCKMMAAIKRNDIYAHDQDDLLSSLLRVHPTVMLDEMLAGDERARRSGVQVFLDVSRFNKHLLDVVSDESLLEWCNCDPVVRYPTAAAFASLFRRPKNGEPHQWMPLAVRLLAKAPEPLKVFKNIVDRLYPTSWSGSLASKLESRLKLLEQLAMPDAPGMLDAFNRAKVGFEERIRKEREREAEEGRSARFE
jgi:hypothetical protein